MPVVTFTREGTLGIITVDNPPLNLMSNEGMTMLDNAITAASTSTVRALLVRAEGEHFVAGVDARGFHEKSAAQARIMFGRSLPVITRLEELPIPTVAAVQGLCQAPGLEIALAADIVVAAESAQFAQIERHLGTTTLLGGIYRIAERAGSARARQIVFDGDRYSAQQFAAWNIINHVVPDDQLQRWAKDLASRYANGPTRALAEGKVLLRRYLDNGIHDADRATLESAVELFDTRDMRRGIEKALAGDNFAIDENNDDFEGH